MRPTCWPPARRSVPVSLLCENGSGFAQHRSFELASLCSAKLPQHWVYVGGEKKCHMHVFLFFLFVGWGLALFESETVSGPGSAAHRQPSREEEAVPFSFFLSFFRFAARFEVGIVSFQILVVVFILRFHFSRLFKSESGTNHCSSPHKYISALLRRSERATQAAGRYLSTCAAMLKRSCVRFPSH